MTPARTRTLVIALVALQAIVLIAMPLLRGARIADGTRVTLAVEPLDPVDLARGRYVSLRYELESASVPEGADQYSDVWVVLRRPHGDTRWWTARDVVSDIDDVPRGATFIKLVVRDGRVDAGRIDTYYADEDEAKRLERDLARGGGIADVSLDDDGNPSLVRVHGDTDG